MLSPTLPGVCSNILQCSVFHTSLLCTHLVLHSHTVFFIYSGSLAQQTQQSCVIPAIPHSQQHHPQAFSAACQNLSIFSISPKSFLALALLYHSWKRCDFPCCSALPSQVCFWCLRLCFLSSAVLAHLTPTEVRRIQVFSLRHSATREDGSHRRHLHLPSLHQLKALLLFPAIYTLQNYKNHFITPTRKTC